MSIYNKGEAQIIYVHEDTL